MPIDLKSAYRNSSSPKIQGRNLVSARPPTGTFRISPIGSSLGDAPEVVEWRPMLGGTPGQNINLLPADGEIGTYINVLPQPPKFYLSDDGFSGMAARVSRIGPETSLTLNHAPADEFRAHYIESVPNDWCFPGTSASKSTPISSVLKSRWHRKGDGQGGKADICVITVVGENISMSGNTSQPDFGVSPLVKFEDFWDFNGRNCVGHYQKAGSPDPIADAGYIEAYLSSNITGPTKTTGTKFISANTPVFGDGTDIDPAETIYDNEGIWLYFITPVGDKPYVANLVTNYCYKAIGPNSFQCLFLMNSATVEASTLFYAYKADSWDGDIEFSTNSFDMTYATHAGVLKPDGSWQIATLESLRI